MMMIPNCFPNEVYLNLQEIQEESDDSPDFTSSAKVSNSNLSKIAEAAGRKMKKLKTNWSIKKSDITRSLSRIKKTSRPSLDLNNSYDGKIEIFSNGVITSRLSSFSQEEIIQEILLQSVPTIHQVRGAGGEL